MLKTLANFAVVFLSVAAFYFIWFSNSSAFEKSTASFAVVLAVLYICSARGYADDE